MEFTLLTVFILWASWAPFNVQSHTIGLCTSTGDANGGGRVWLLTYHIKVYNKSPNPELGYINVTSSTTGISLQSRLSNVCDLSNNHGSPSEKILACPSVPADSEVVCYTKDKANGKYLVFKGDDTTYAFSPLYQPYGEKNVSMGAYASISIDNGDYRITTTGADLVFASDPRTYLEFSTETGSSETVYLDFGRQITTDASSKRNQTTIIIIAVLSSFFGLILCCFCLFCIFLIRKNKREKETEPINAEDNDAEFGSTNEGGNIPTWKSTRAESGSINGKENDGAQSDSINEEDDENEENNDDEGETNPLLVIFN